MPPTGCFPAWYVHSFSAQPDAALLTDDEVRDYRAYLTGVRSYKAATVNAYLASIRAIVRAQGRMLKVKGVKQVSGPVETVDTRDLGRLSEALALKIGDVELGPRSGASLVREGKGLKERTLALSAETRGSLQANLKVRPKVDGDLLFFSRTNRSLNPRDVQRMVCEAARRAGIKFNVTPHTLRHSFATRFLTTNQGDIATLATILGHANISTTTRYLHPNAQQVQEMVEAL